MMNESGVSGIFSFAELNYLRMEAMDLFERCLTEGEPNLLELFVEKQISQDPPRLELLREVAEDLHQRMLELHANRYDVRERALQILREEFAIDPANLLPLTSMKPDQQLSIEDALAVLQQQQKGVVTAHDRLMLHKKLNATLMLEAQLHRDVLMTYYLYKYVMDWVMGLNTVFTQHYWARTHHDPISNHLH